MLAPFAFVQFCLRKPTRFARSKEIRLITLDEDHRRRLEKVHYDVKRSIASVPRPNGLKSWNDDATAGGCRDYALAKRSRLLDMGYPSSALLLAVAFIPSGDAHLVLVVVTDRGNFVLDNLQQTMVRWDQLPYRWMMRSTPQNPQHWRMILPLQNRIEAKRRFPSGGVPADMLAILCQPSAGMRSRANSLEGCRGILHSTEMLLI